MSSAGLVESTDYRPTSPHQATEVGRFEMWRPMTDRMNHDKAWGMGVLEPILLVLFIATIGVLLDLL